MSKRQKIVRPYQNSAFVMGSSYLQELQLPSKAKMRLPIPSRSANDKIRKATEDTPLTAQISILPYANEKVAARILEHAQDLKDTDPKQSIELHEEVIRFLCSQIRQRNKKIRILKKILMKTLHEGEVT